MIFKDELKKSLRSYFYKNWPGSKNVSELCNDICNILPDKTYEDGLNDAWENVRKIVLGQEEGGYSAGELGKIFGYDFGTTYTILYKYDALEVSAKIKAYEEEKNKIHIGDEVFSYAFNDKGIVTKICSNNIITIVCDKTSSISTSIDKVHKTGKSYPQIVEYYEFLEQYSKDKKESEENNNE